MLPQAGPPRTSAELQTLGLLLPHCRAVSACCCMQSRQQAAQDDHSVFELAMSILSCIKFGDTYNCPNTANRHDGPVVQGKEGIRGKPWFVESDLKGGAALKLDKTGKAILTVLRHLSRLTEVRCPLPRSPYLPASLISCTSRHPGLHLHAAHIRSASYTHQCKVLKAISQCHKAFCATEGRTEMHLVIDLCRCCAAGQFITVAAACMQANL